MKRLAILLAFSIASFGPLGAHTTSAYAGPQVITLRYAGDIHGARAQVVSFERLPEYHRSTLRLFVSTSGTASQ